MEGQGFLDRAPVGFVSLASDGTVLDVNSTLVEMLATTRADVVGRPFESLLTVASRIFYQTHLFPLLRLQPTVEEIFLTMRRGGGGGGGDGRGGGGDGGGGGGGGGEDVAMLSNFARRDAAGVTTYDGVLMRLRERRKWEDEIVRARRTAEETTRANTALLSMMSHDLRTPIGAISGYCDLLTLGVRGPMNEQQLSDIARIKKASEFLLSLIDDVLSFARMSGGQITDLDMRPLDTDTVLTQTETLIGPRIEQARIEYRREGCAPDVKVVADPDRLQQILLNLLTNAVKFTPAGGRITISCASDGDLTRISVADTGKGIPADQLDRIFEPFVQATGTAGTGRGNQKGFGLGLAISRGLARRMNGDLTVSSEVGVGSTFTLTLAGGRTEDS